MKHLRESGSEMQSERYLRKPDAQKGGELLPKGL